ncbi:unnamed protein product [Pleuronectes platessa]|uniref:Uncharacterized protein n=1 Tax=Pleuronectes platessa TaxID=8262 RepID=A0A9N7TXT6_PLEPL|nr:unnamed protein product [Pleuronectes platessa]
MWMCWTRSLLSVQVSPSGRPLRHLSLRPDLLRAASSGQEDAFVSGRHESTKRGGPSFHSCFDPSIERTQACMPPARMAGLRLVRGWGLAEPGALMHMALQQKGPIDEATDWL